MNTPDQIVSKCVHLLSESHWVVFLFLFSTELLKRLDDSSEEVRSAALKACGLWLSSLTQEYNPEFYAAHLQFFFQHLLLFLDDPDSSVQEHVLGESAGVWTCNRRLQDGTSHGRLDHKGCGCIRNTCSWQGRWLWCGCHPAMAFHLQTVLLSTRYEEERGILHLMLDQSWAHCQHILTVHYVKYHHHQFFPT